MRQRHFVTLAGVIALATGAVILAMPGKQAAAEVPGLVTDDECSIRITLLGKDEQSHTWTYRVENEQKKDCEIEFWLLELCDRAFEAYKSSSPQESSLVEHEPWSELTGVKWKIADDFKEGTFTVTFDQQLKEKDITLAFKVKPHVLYGKIEGPSCDEKPTATPTATETEVPHTSTPTDTPEEATSTPTDTKRTSTPTSTPEESTATPTSTPEESTATPTERQDTATPTSTRPASTSMPTHTQAPSTATPTATSASAAEGAQVAGLPSAGSGGSNTPGGSGAAVALIGLGLVLLLGAWGRTVSQLALNRRG